ncbi:hypothetical protein J7643_03595 [bacterium]|nr:hypothetical protein [bacterium]
MPLILDAAVPDIPPPSETTAVFVPKGGDAAGALAPIATRIRELASDASVLAIVDQPSLQAAADILAEVKGAAKQLDGLKAIFVTPLETAAKLAKNQFKPLTDLLDVTEKRLKEITKAYLEAERAKEVQAAQVRQSELIGSASAPEVAGIAATVPTYVAPPPKAAGVSMAKHWTYDIEDIRVLARALADGTVPESYLQVNSGALQAAIRNGAREIPGLRIFQEGRVVAR